MYNPFNRNLISAERDLSGQWFYEYKNGQTANRFACDEDRFNAVMYNPAYLKVVKLQCDMFSMGKIQAFRNKKELQNDLLVKSLRYPNKFQTQRQFLWDYMFWLMTFGNSYLYSSSKIVNEDNNLYFLNPVRLVWTDELIKKLDKIVVSNKSFNDIENLNIKYANLDGTYSNYKLKDIKPFFDLSNGLGNWYKANSPVDALYKIIYNSEKALDAKGINLEFAGKYLVSGQHKETDTYGLPMDGKEKDSIERSVRSEKPVHAVKAMIDIKRFVENIDNLKLDVAYMSSYFKIGNFFGIPREVLEANESGSTYENQEKARGAHVEYCLQTKGNDLVDGIEKMFGYTEKNIDLIISWKHLSFMQVFEKERSAVKASQLANLRVAQEMEALTPEEVINAAKEIMGYE